LHAYVYVDRDAIWFAGTCRRSEESLGGSQYSAVYLSVSRRVCPVTTIIIMRIEARETNACVTRGVNWMLMMEGELDRYLGVKAALRREGGEEMR